MKIIDAHAHIGSFPTLASSKQLILSSMEKYGIAYSLVSNTDGAEFPSVGDLTPKNKPTLEILKQTVAFHLAHPNQIGALLWIRPQQEQPSQELIRYINTHRKDIVGMKFHPYEERLPIDDPRLKAWLDLAKRFRFPLLVHTAIDEYSSIKHLENVCLAYPDLNFVAAHMELCTDNLYCLETMRRCPNMYADCAWVPLDIAKRVLREIGLDRIMFGTDNPVDGAFTLANPLYREYFAPNNGLSGIEEEHLFCLNAQRFYNLPII